MTASPAHAFVAPRVRRSFGGAALALGLSILHLLSVWDARWRMRRRLADLPAWQRRDLNLEPAALRREAEKPFWRRS